MSWQQSKSKSESRSIFVTGVVQQAASAGTIRSPEEIEQWVSGAVSAFNKHIDSDGGSFFLWLLGQIDRAETPEDLARLSAFQSTAVAVCTHDEVETLKEKHHQKRKDVL